MRLLIIGDSHMDDPYLEEQDKIWEEIFQVDADEVIHLGDFFNKNRPSPNVLNRGTRILCELVAKYGKVNVLAGNGSHESLNGYNINGYMEWVGVNPMSMQEEIERDGKKIFLGHIMTNESYKEYGSHEVTVKELRKYDYAFLGHQHNPQDITDKIFHVGSIFYQNFNEVKDNYKRVALLEDGKLEWIQLKSPTPMQDAFTVQELESLSSKTKVRLILKSFNDFKENVDRIAKFREKFVKFEVKLDFEAVQDKPITSEVDEKPKSLQVLLDEELTKIEDKDVRELLRQQFKEQE